MDAAKSLATSVSNAFAGLTAREAKDAAGDGNEADETTHGALKSVNSRTVGSRAQTDFATNSGTVFRAVSSDEESDSASEFEDGDGGGAKRKMRLETCASLNVFDPGMREGHTPRLKPVMKVWQFLLLFVGELAAATGLVLLYTMIGYGADVYSGLTESNYWKLSWSVAGGSVAMFGILWILGAAEAARQSERHTGKYLSFFFSAIAASGLAVSGLLSIKEYETMPLAFYILAKTGLVRAMKKTVCKHTHNGSFLLACAYASFIVALLSAGVWTFWVFKYDKTWSSTLFNSFEVALGCTASDDMTSSSCGNAAYIMWGVPLAITGLNVVYGSAAKSLSKKGGALKIIMILALIVGFGLWVSVALSAVEMGVADDVIQLCIVFCALFGIACFVTAGPGRVYRQVKSNKLATKVIGYSQTEVAKAMIFCCTMTLIPFGLAISALSSAARKVGLSFYKKPKDLPPDGFLTIETRAILDWLFSRPTKILLYSAYLSIFYFTFSIGVGKGAVLFLAWLVDVLSGLSRGVVILLFILIGVAMFLLPPVPGPPVYLTGGILVVGNLEPDYGFWPATFICIGVCWFTKLLACALQQKMIGEQLSGFTRVRQMVGINSLQMRAIRFCLEEKGLTLPKVAILCGGPDWPTSVLCGILKLSLFQCMLGTMPVLVLFLGYTTIAGALQLKVGSCGTTTTVPASGSWNMLNSVFLALAFMSMMATSFGAVYFMEKTIETKREALDAMPIDEEVMELEKAQEERDDAYQRVSEWSALSRSSKILLWFSAVTGVLSCQLGVVLSQRAFASFSVSCPVAVKDVVKPPGWISIGLITACMVSVKIFSRIQKTNASKFLETQKREQSTRAC